MESESSADKKLEFDDKFQEKLLACMLKITSFNTVASQYVQQHHFTGTIYKNIAKTFLDYHREFGGCISDYAYVEIIGLKFNGDKENLMAHISMYGNLRRVDVTDSDFVLHKLIEFIKVQSWKSLIDDSVKRYLEEGRSPNLKALESEATKIINISTINKSEGYDYFLEANISERVESRKLALTAPRGVSTGIRDLDLRLANRGFSSKELIIILASAKKGKSFCLLWFANAAAQAGKNVCYFTLENSRQVCTDRLDACNTGILYSDLGVNDNVVPLMKSKTPKGNIRIYEYPTKSCSTSQIEQHLITLEKQEAFRADILLVDYLDLLRNPLAKEEDILIQQATNTENLRGLAGKFNIPVVTASQINRAGTGKSINSGVDIAGSIGKVQIADQIICLSSTDDEARNKELKIVLSESRNNASGVIKIKTAYERGCFFDKVIGMSD